MGSLGADNYAERVARRKARYAQLIAKGLNPRSQKFLKLLYRR